MLRKLTVGVLATSMSLCAWAEDDHYHQQSAHVHGLGTMNVAVDGNSLFLELEIPAQNLVGFEHAPETEAQAEAVKKVEQRLRAGRDLFQPSTQAGCELQDVTIHSALLNDEATDPTDAHQDSHHDDHHPEEHRAADDEPDLHADFELYYQYSCRESEQLTTLELTLFRHFPGLERLAVQFIGHGGQGHQELSAQKPVLTLR